MSHLTRGSSDLVSARQTICHAVAHALPLFPVETALERDYFMTAQEALDFGIIDEILENRRPSFTEGGKSTDAT
jgi:ATP-dependent protease ClpP protease subunit